MLGRGIVVAAIGSALLYGCADSTAETTGEIDEIVANLGNAGFPADDIRVVDGVVYVGRDAEVTLAASREMVASHDTGKEQYRTTNLISSTLTKICVNGATFTGVFSTALDLAIQNFDEQPLTFSMARTPSTGCSVTINAVLSPGVVGGSAGFPSGGLPYPTINIGDGLATFSVDTIEHVITHELGHTIGFRHSDYFNRSISCGSGGDEGDAGVGAIHIPGTPTGANVGGSLMNSCFRTLEIGELTASDVTALRALYMPTQSNWKWCRKCQGLFFQQAGTVCPAGGAHDGSLSGSYSLIHSAGGGPNLQDNWRWCSKCQGLFYPNAGSVCPAGGSHNVGVSGNYTLIHGVGPAPGTQDNWRWCSKCQGLFYPNAGSVCPAGGTHNVGVGNYSVLHQ